MLKHWEKLLNTDCTVVGIGQHTVYPIFKVGSSSLFAVADKTYTNREIRACDHIDIMIRDPGDRFVSGINEYSRQNNLDVEQTWGLAEQGKLVDRHFAPQFVWLFHLYKFYKGTVTLRPFSYIKKITNTHMKTYNARKEKNVAVSLLKSFVEVDYALAEHYNETFELGRLVKEHKNVLS